MFKIKLDIRDEVYLPIEGYEALRLADLEGYFEKTAQSPDTYFKNWAARLLAEIGK